MKAILINPDQSLRWDDVPDPVCGTDDVLVEVHYAALNRADLLQRAGDYPPPPGCPDWMGLEVSGIIIAMGDGAKEKSDFKIGDRVCALLGGGGYAEYVSVKYDMLMHVPKNLSLAEAAAIPEVYTTAYLNLFYEGKAQKGDTVLMQAGASGLASAVIPMAKAFGMRVITTVRRDAFVDAIAPLGADRIINTKNEDLVAVLKEELDAGTPVSVCIDCLGGTGMGGCLPYLARGARWIMIAALAGTVTEIDLKNIYVRNVRIIGSTLRSRDPAVKAELLDGLVRDIYPLFENGTLQIHIDSEFPITDAEAAQARMQNGDHVGKILLKVR